MAKKYVALNRTSIAALPSAPAGKRETYYLQSARKNEQVPAGFIVQVTDKGSKSFYVVRRIAGAQRRVFIAKTDDITTDVALEEAWRITSAIARHEDPEAARKALKASASFDQTTVAEYWKAYKARHVKRLRPRTRVLYDGLATKYILPKLGKKPLAAVSRAMVAKFHDEVTAEVAAKDRAGDGGRTANLAVNLLRSMFNDALDREAITGANPAQRIKKAKEVRRERFLSLEEIGRLYKALEDDALKRGDWTWSDLFRLLLSTGARRSNVLAMRWSEVDLNERFWSIPAGQTKTGTVYLVALEPGAVEILQRRLAEAAQLAEVNRKASGDPSAEAKLNPYVFPSRGKSGHLAEVKGAWQRICKLAGLTDVRVHDLRHTHASLLASRGVSLQMIGAQLGHRSTTTTARYAHLARGPVQIAVEEAFKHLADNGGKTSDDESD